MGILKWALIFFLVAIVAALFGFTGIAAAATDVARILFAVFLVLFLVLLVIGLLRKPGRPSPRNPPEERP